LVICKQGIARNLLCLVKPFEENSSRLHASVLIEVALAYQSNGSSQSVMETYQYCITDSMKIIWNNCW